MKTMACRRIPGVRMQMGGFVGNYLRGLIEQWLLVAPKANPAMLEMFRDRDASPLRDMVPWAGEFAGKYLTGAVQVLRVTRDPALKAWLRWFVRRLISLQAEDGYLGPWPKRCRLTNTDSRGQSTWDTWSHYHIMLGLMLWHEETRDADALACASRIADLICRKYLGRRKKRLVDTGCTEMNLAPVHALAMLYRKTATERYLKMALQIVEEFAATDADGRPLAGDYLRQALAGREFFQTPKPRWESLHPIMGLAELYWITGQEKYREAFTHLWWSIARFDRHNNGGFSSGEQALGDPYDFGAIETCCTIAWAAMCVEMLKMTANPVVADELELSTFNSVVGMHSSTGRWCTYNTPMNGVRRAFTTDANWHAREGSPELNCCSVNSSRGFGLLSDWALMKDRQGLILNYYGPSTMKARLAPALSVSLTQQTDYPLDDRVSIRLTPSSAAEFALKLRIPHWSERTSLKLNGKAVPCVEPGRYTLIRRKWRPGDRLELKLDLSLRFWRGERDCAGLASVYRGPILLTYDHRYNLHNAPRGKQQVFAYYLTRKRNAPGWHARDCMLSIPQLDARNMKPRRVQWEGWLPPALLVECRAANGKTVRLCDFGSAGEAGTPYVSWLPVRHLPPPAEFSRANPSRTSRCRG